MTLRQMTVGFLVLGVAGLCLAGFGVMPGAPAWCWLVVLALAVVTHVAEELTRQRARIDRRTRRQMEANGAAIAKQTKRLDDFLELWGPAQQKNRDDVLKQLMADFQPVRDVIKSGQLTSTIQALVSGRRG